MTIAQGSSIYWMLVCSLSYSTAWSSYSSLEVGLWGCDYVMRVQLIQGICDLRRRHSGVVAHTCNPSTYVADVGGSWVLGLPGLNAETLSWKNNIKKTKLKRLFTKKCSFFPTWWYNKNLLSLGGRMGSWYWTSRSHNWEINFSYL